MSRIHSQQEVFIRAQPEAVWRVHTDIEAWKEWQPDVAAAHITGPIAAGTVFRWKSGGLSINSTIQDVETAKRITWSGTALGTRAFHSWNLTPQDGGTLVSTDESMEGWLVTLLKAVMPGFLAKSLRQWLQSLKARVERQNS